MTQINGEPACADYLQLRERECNLRDYQRFFYIQQSNLYNLFFFAIETSVGLGKETKDFVKLLARLAGRLSNASTRR
jgi:hypothetical protein